MRVAACSENPREEESSDRPLPEAVRILKQLGHADVKYVGGGALMKLAQK